MAEAALQADSLVFGYDESPVVRGVTLEIQSGEFFGILGPNGAGKSTLLRLLSGYLKPASGGVRLLGRDIADLSRREIASHLAFVGQRAHHAFSFRVLEMVMMGRHPYAGLISFDTEEDKEIALQALDRLGIPDFAAKRYDQLSGGEQQSVLLARAIAQETPILLLDEPVTFLDIRREWEVMELLRGMQEEGRTIVATFHDLNAAARWCSRIALLSNGRIVAMGTPAEVLTADILESVYQIPLCVDAAEGRPPRIGFPA